MGTENNLENKVEEQKIEKNTSKLTRTSRGVALAAFSFSALSNILMPFIVIEYYDRTKDYLTKHPEEINPYHRTAEINARYNAGMIGAAWSSANVMAALLALTILNSTSYSASNKQKKTGNEAS